MSLIHACGSVLVLVDYQARLLPAIDQFRQWFDFSEIVPISANTGEGVEELEKSLLAMMPEGEPIFPPDHLTDQPERFFVAELVREQVLHHTRAELPFSSAVIVDKFDEPDEKGLLRLYCTILVERESQKPIVIGRGGRYIRAEDALDAIAGFVVLNDASCRDWQRAATQWTAGKNFVGSMPIGPEVVTTDEVDVSDLAISSTLNGTVMQSARTSQMLVSVPAAVEFFSSFTHLAPGDVIATGTPADSAASASARSRSSRQVQATPCARAISAGRSGQVAAAWSSAWPIVWPSRGSALPPLT